MIVDVEEHLEHFGVKGMRWGVRRRSDADIQARIENLHRKKDRKALLKEYDSMRHPVFRKKTKIIAGSVAVGVGLLAVNSILTERGDTAFVKALYDF